MVHQTSSDLLIESRLAAVARGINFVSFSSIKVDGEKSVFLVTFGMDVPRGNRVFEYQTLSFDR